MKITVNKDGVGKRLDEYIALNFKEMTRSKIQKELKNEKVRINNEVITKKNYKLKYGDEITFVFENFNDEFVSKRINEILPENIELDIVYEDEEILVINKPKGMLVHPTNKELKGTLYNALLYYLGDNIADGSGENRRGIVHRIDKDTSGLLVVAKTNRAYENLRKDFDEHNIKREYVALCYGRFKDTKDKIETYIGRDEKGSVKRKVTQCSGKKAITRYEVLEQVPELALVKLKLETGRTHQIRVHLKYINHPIVGDKLYGNKNQKFGSNGQFLHAISLGFNHPKTNEFMMFNSEVPNSFFKLLNSEKMKSK